MWYHIEHIVTQANDDHRYNEARKVKVAQDLWNTRDPERVVLAYTVRTSLPLCREGRADAVDS